MLANGSDWSSLVRTTSHGCGPSGRRGCSFILGHSVQLPSSMFATCSTVGFFAASTSPLAMLFSIDHCVRWGLKPSLTDQTQVLVRTSTAYSTASLDFCVASTMAG